MTARRTRAIWRIGAGVIAAIAAVVCLAAIGIVVLTNTAWGHAQARRIALRALRGPVHGMVHIGTVSGDLLDHLIVTDVSITDSGGAPFVSVRRATVRYRLTDLLHRRLALMDVRVDDPVVVLVESPDSGWNYRRIFPESAKPSSGPSTGFGSHLTLADLQIVGGDLTVRSPWRPDPSLRGTARDSAIAAATGSESRDRVRAVPGGFEKTFAVHALTASAPAVRLADPERPTKLFQVAALRADVAAFRPPDAQVADVAGTFYLDSDSLWWHQAEVHLRASRVSGRGAYQLESGNLDVVLHADSAALADLHFLDPRLPDAGGLTAGVVMTWRGARQDYVVRDLRLESGTARATGQLGVTIGDSLVFHGTDLQFRGVDTRLIEQVAPSLRIPRRGTVAGHAVLAGPMSGLTLNADVSYDDSVTGVSRVAARGELGLGSGIVDAHRLSLTVSPLQVALIAPSASTSPIGGTISGHATLNGSTRSAMRAQADLIHQDGSALTHVVATGDVAFAPPRPSPTDESGVALRAANAHGRVGSTGTNATDHASGLRPERVEMVANVEPLDLTEVAKLFPAAKLYGRAAGGIRISGDMDDLGVHVRFGVLGTPDSAALTLDGHLHLRDTIPGYDLTLGAHVFDARSVSHAAPPTTVTATITAAGRGVHPATMATTVDAHVRASAIDSVRVDTLDLHAVADGGQLRIDTAHMRALASTLDVNGSLGLAAGRSGTLSYHLTIDSLHGWRQFLPHDTTAVAMRGEALEGALERARADSARRADSTEVERAISGTPGANLTVDTPRAIRRDTLAGRVTTSGTIRGNLHDFDVQGTLDADSVIALGNAARHAQLLYQWSGAPGLTAPVAATARVESLTLGGFSLDSLDARVTYRRPDGTVRLVVLQDSLRGYTLGALFSYSPSEKQLRYDTLAFRFDTTLWRAPHPGSITWDTSGLTVHQVELDDGRIGRIAIDGRIGRADTGGGGLSIALQRVSLANLAALAQVGTPLEGEISVHAQLGGSLEQPQLRGSASLSDATARDLPLPNVFASYSYDTATTLATVELAPKGAPSVPFAHMTATVPIDLALNATGSRLPDRPLSGELQLDSLPLGAAAEFESSITGLAGLVTGRVSLAGTVRRPSPSGTLAITRGAATVTAAGARLTGVAASVRLTRDSIIVDSLVAHTPSTGGTLRLAGVLDRSDSVVPVANVTVAASDLRVLDTRDQGRLDVDANLTVAGPTATPYIYGTTTVRDGVYYLAESNGKDIVDLTQPVVYHVADTTQPAIRALLPTSGSLFTRLLMDVDVKVDRGTWVRNPDGNVEVHTSGPLTVHTDHAHQALVVNGTISSDQGEYRFLGKRFTISKGVATFIGAPTLNPTLTATGEYALPVAVPGQEALAININITGNVDSLRLALSSSSEPPVSQSDLLSYLAFGSATSGQTSQSSSLSGSSSGGFVGTAGTFVENQLAAEAVGVVANQLKGNLARALDADVFAITTGNNYTDITTNRNNAAAVFFQNTQIEFGKYFTPRTFVSLQASVAPGASVTHRLGSGLSMQVSGQPLYLLGQPTLATNQDTPLTGVLGLTLFKTWKF